MKFFYEKNNKLLESPVNKKFEEILWMSETDFQIWVADMRKEVVKIWDEDGIPPRVGFDESEIKEQFGKIEPFPVHEFLTVDALTKKKDVIRNTSVVGNAANQWFPTMMKTKINYTSDVNGGLSIYDHFKNPDLLEKMITYGRRHFKRDSFYHYSNPVRKFGEPKDFLYACETAEEWISKFEARRGANEKEFDYWLDPKEEENNYTGYDESLREANFLRLKKSDLPKNIPDHCKTNLSYRPDAEEYQIRLFKKGQTVFPVGLKAFRISVCQYAVNFPPLTAKYLYERYTKHIENQVPINIWDPSAGWGGRLLGAMGVSEARRIHYIGTDPNTDHKTTSGRTKYHELADFYNTQTSRAGRFYGPVNTFEIYQCGSEEMSKEDGFRKYKGRLDLVFTSPPYFAKEIYSADAEQSANKFPKFEAWVDGFLRPTLETAVEWLAKDRYLLWNIADAKFGKEMLPLEEESNKILKSLGMVHVETLKMALAQMPGGNRIEQLDEEITETKSTAFGAETTTKKKENPLAKNFCKVIERSKKGAGKEIWFKYEPIFVWRKP